MSSVVNNLPVSEHELRQLHELLERVGKRTVKFALDRNIKINNKPGESFYSIKWNGFLRDITAKTPGSALSDVERYEPLSPDLRKVLESIPDTRMTDAVRAAVKVVPGQEEISIDIPLLVAELCDPSPPKPRSVGEILNRVIEICDQGSSEWCDDFAHIKELAAHARRGVEKHIERTGPLEHPTVKIVEKRADGNHVVAYSENLKEYQQWYCFSKKDVEAGWIPWYGHVRGYTPLPPKMIVRTRTKKGGEREGYVHEFEWGHRGLEIDIIAYRAVNLPQNTEFVEYVGDIQS